MYRNTAQSNNSTESLERFEEVSLLGIKFHKVSVCQLISYIVRATQLNKKTIVSNVNIRAMNIAYEQSWYREFLNQSDIVFCDGFGILKAANLMGIPMASCHRMTCPDYIESLAKACESANVSLFLLAGKPGITDQAIAQLTAIAPKLRVEGHHGYFNKSGMENDAVIKIINEFSPDILYIGFGMPLQERWITENIHRIESRVFLPLGACLDFYTGNVYRGPRWMTDRGLEWLTRLVTEPRRLWSRYVVGNPLFFYRIFKHWLTKYKPSKV